MLGCSQNQNITFSRSWRDEASKILSKAKRASEKEERLESLPFKKEDVATIYNEITKNGQLLQQMITLVNKGDK